MKLESRCPLINRFLVKTSVVKLIGGLHDKYSYRREADLDSKLSKRITHSHNPRCGFKTGVPSGERGNLPERPADPTLAPRVSFTPVVLNSSK